MLPSGAATRSSHAESGVSPVVDSADLNDDGFLDLWTRTVEGVRYSIRRVTDAASLTAANEDASAHVGGEGSE